MRSQPMVFLVTPLQLYTIITICSLFLIIESSNGGNGGVPGAPRDCRRSAIFKLEYCPSVRLGDEAPDSPWSYQVLDINNSTITLGHLNHPTGAPLCPIPLGDLPFELNPLNYSSSTELISLVHNDSLCHYPDVKSEAHPSDSIECWDGHGLATYYYLWNHSNIEDKDQDDSRQFIKVPVLRNEIDRLKNRNGSLEDVLKQGFELDYPAACLGCGDSGGKCGSMNYTFTCFPPRWGMHPYLPQYKYGSKSDKEIAPKRSAPKHGKSKLKLGIGILVGFLFLAALIIALFYYKKHKLRSATLLSRRVSYYHTRTDLETANSFFEVPVFSYTELEEATHNFDPARELGDGGFGVVYHGKLRDGREVAVKRLYERNYNRVEQFRNEVEILNKLSHPNLVTLYGCTSRHSRELLLVYEYMTNGTVADHLHQDQSGSRYLPWAIRMKIAVQTAEAVSYLHASDIIHRDVKTNNILLDNNFMVKVADFGLSRLFPVDATHISTAPHGTPGYLDPEYDKCYRLTDKSDVYSFGVVLIELISSLPAVDISRDEDEINLSTYAMNKIQQGKLCELVDQMLGFESYFKVKRMVTLVAELAFQCLQQEKEIRPSMEEVLKALKQIESMDYEALEAEEISLGFERSKPASRAVESQAEKPF